MSSSTSSHDENPLTRAWRRGQPLMQVEDDGKIIVMMPATRIDLKRRDSGFVVVAWFYDCIPRYNRRGGFLHLERLNDKVRRVSFNAESTPFDRHDVARGPNQIFKFVDRTSGETALCLRMCREGEYVWMNPIPQQTRGRPRTRGRRR